MAGNKESAKKGAEVQKAKAKDRQAEADRNATAKNPNNPGPPSEAWARKRGLIKDDD
jgi:hypothetical protein